jgi:hypothetical protein
MEKKGQVSFFVLGAAILLILVSFILYVNRLDTLDVTEGSDFSSEINSVTIFVKECLKQTAIDGIYYVSSKGGFYEDPVVGVDYFFNPVPIYFFFSMNLSISQDFFEESLSDFIEDSIDFCINDFEDFPVEIDTPEVIDAHTSFTRDDVVFNLNYPITIHKNDDKVSLTDFSVTLPVRMKDLHEASLKVTEIQMEDNENICLSCLLDVALDKEVDIYFENYDNDTIIFRILMNTTIVEDEQFELIFANRYDLE